MPRFRKKSVIIEAEQWFKVTYDREAGHGIEPEDMPIYHLGVEYFCHPEALVEEQLCPECGESFRHLRVGYFCHPEALKEPLCSECGKSFHVHGYIINTVEGGHKVCPGDWIITGVGGERYPIKNDIFLGTYTLVEPESSANDSCTVVF